MLVYIHFSTTITSIEGGAVQCVPYAVEIEVQHEVEVRGQFGEQRVEAEVAADGARDEGQHRHGGQHGAPRDGQDLPGEQRGGRCSTADSTTG